MYVCYICLSAAHCLLFHLHFIYCWLNYFHVWSFEGCRGRHFPDVSTESHTPMPEYVHTSNVPHTHTHSVQGSLIHLFAMQVTETSTTRWMTVWLRHLKPVTSEWMFIWILLPAVSHTGGNSLELQQQECKYYGESHWDMKCSFNYNIDISRSVSQRMWRELDLSFFCPWFLVWFGVHTH